MAFIRNKQAYKTGDKVTSTVPLRNPNGTFTSGHSFVVVDIKKSSDQRDGDFVTITVRCPVTQEVATTHKKENFELEEPKGYQIDGY